MLAKKQGGLGVTNVTTHNNAILLKFLHKFYSKADIPWVNLVWENYYSNGELPGQRKRDHSGGVTWSNYWTTINVTKLIVGGGRSILLWKDCWNGQITAQHFPELAILGCVQL